MSQDQYIQELINKSVTMATRSALTGNPLEQVVWIPPQSASDDPYGSFMQIPYPELSSCDRWPL